jgi:excisionase family DNA binding protein
MSSNTLAALRLHTVEEVSESTGIPVSTLRKLIAGQSIPFVRVGSGIRFRATDLAQWLDQNTVPTRSIGGKR